MARDRSGTCRCVYTVKFGTAIYVLHAFQKKSRKGIATPKEEIEMIKRRLKLASETDVEVAAQKRRGKENDGAKTGSRCDHFLPANDK